MTLCVQAFPIRVCVCGGGGGGRGGRAAFLTDFTTGVSAQAILMWSAVAGATIACSGLKIVGLMLLEALGQNATTAFFPAKASMSLLHLRGAIT